MVYPLPIFSNFVVRKTTRSSLTSAIMTLKQIYRHPLMLILVAFIAAGIGVSCSNSQHQAQLLSDAESIADEYPDSALALIDVIDPAELTVDSLKAKYYYILAFAHDRHNHIALSDSMISFSNDYYRNKDLKRSILSATLLAAYKFRIGERETALKMLDSLSTLNNVPDTLLIEPLRNRISLGSYYGPNESRIKRLMKIDKDKNWYPQYKFLLYIDLFFSGKNDSGLVVLDDIIDLTAREDTSERFGYEYEKIGALVESGYYAEGMNLADSLMKEPIGNSIRHYFHLWKSLAWFNMRNHSAAAGELAMADSLSTAIPEDERGYFNSFTYILHTLLDYQNTGRASVIPLARITNIQRDNLYDAQHLRQEAAQRALEIENQRLTIKAKSDRQTALLIITILVALIVSGALIWYALNKKRKALEILERNEVLQKLVDESNNTQKDSSTNDTLRRAMLQQLGIIKMVAETPTQQNRDMLRKLSSVENGKDGSLVNWENVFGMIDNLYSGFYSRLHNRHGSVLSDKEEQIIALMVAGFSTKEISVISGQTTATIYVRKSSIRKKLALPEKEDIVAFLRREADD